MDTATQTGGQLTFEDKVIAKIARLNVQDIPGLLEMDGNVVDSLTETITQDERVTKGIKVNVGDKQVALDLAVVLKYGTDARQFYTEACTRITAALEQMTGLKLVALNLNVSDIMTEREWRQSQN
mgnify:CR=1 FL=1